VSPEVTIAINSYRSPDLLASCLRSIEEHLPGSGIAYEVLVADSATEEPTRQVMEDFPEARFYPFKENVGFKSLVNTSIREARGTYVFLINSDIILKKDTVPLLLSYAKAHPEAGLIGPKQYGFNGAHQNSCFRFYRPETILYRRTVLGRLPFGRKHLAWFEMQNERDTKEPIPVEWLMGSALFVSKAHAELVGPMDNRFFMYMEDVDWSRRFWEKGLRVIYYPEASVYHYHQKGSAKGGFFGSLFFNRLTRYHIASAFRYFWKYRNRKEPAIF
jgi:GT2 family glycosyltransferase